MGGLDSSDYRNVHSDFVKNFVGMGATETFLAIVSFPLSNAIVSLSLPWLLPKQYPYVPYTSRAWTQTMIEFAVSVPLLIFNLTAFAEYCLWTAGVMILAVLGLMYLNCKYSPSPYKTMGKSDFLDTAVHTQKPSYLTNFRGSMMLATVLCILAVDFPSFPRRFAKTEAFGYSLMDTGVGGFTFLHGLSSAPSRAKQSILFRELKNSVLLIVLGLLRLISLRAVNYHEVVSEYGVHWNFFFTLAFTKIFGAWLMESFPQRRPLTLAILIMCSYELLLKLGLQDWILGDSPRSDLLSSNREGVFSLAGYVALHLLAVEVKQIMNTPLNMRQLLETLARLASVAVITWIALLFASFFSDKPSRRLANSAYVAWMLFFNVTILGVTIGLEVVLKLTQYYREKNCTKKSMEGIVKTKELPLFTEPYLMRVINFNGLLFFVAANVLTGLVNLTLDTVHGGSFLSITVLLAYALTLVSLVTVLYIRRSQFRLK